MYDKSNKKTCLESIKMFTIPPFVFDLTNIYDDEFDLSFAQGKFELEIGEEPICSTVINESHWSILTTRRICTLEGVRKKTHLLDGLKKFDAGDFKGNSTQKFTTGLLLFEDNEIVRVFIETGRPSMVMIYGNRTIFDKTRVKRWFSNET